MNAAELRHFKQRLIAEERYLLQEIEGQMAELEDSAEAASEERMSAPDDASAEIFEHEKVLAVEGAFEDMLAEVRHALHKIDAGTYGICDECGQPIDIERLQARPQAAMCVPCKAHDEQAHPGHVHGLVGSR
ncbi:MAG TPA: TraR/DksA C4-type zinc finger protein [Chloroflexota bacterium]|nr:TraR/DksA C4-type zinc finger protein [Chloroflexota bacterium]